MLKCQKAKNKLGLSCAKLRASLNLSGFDFGFAKLAHEFNFGLLFLFLWKFWYGLVGLVL